METRQYSAGGEEWLIMHAEGTAGEGVRPVLYIQNLTQRAGYVLDPQIPTQQGAEISHAYIDCLREGQAQGESIDPSTLDNGLREELAGSLIELLGEYGHSPSQELLAGLTTSMAGNPNVVPQGFDGPMADKEFDEKVAALTDGTLEQTPAARAASHAERFRPAEGGYRGSEDQRREEGPDGPSLS